MSGPESQWRAALSEGRFLLQRGVRSGRAFFPPRLVEPGSGSEVEWFESSGGGAVHAVTVISPRPPEPPRAVVLIDLDDGPRLMGRVDGIAPAEIEIGLRVRAIVIRDGDEPVLAFVPA
jgi:hypothetical protein